MERIYQLFRPKNFVWIVSLITFDRRNNAEMCEAKRDLDVSRNAQDAAERRALAAEA